MSRTELLTYTIERQVVSVPSRGAAVSLAKNAPSIAMGERLAAERLRLTGRRSSRENPQAVNSSRDHRSDCAPVSAIADVFISLLKHWCEIGGLAGRWGVLLGELVSIHPWRICGAPV